MNEHFVNVKVDREERPDLDAVYMDAVVALTGHGGWPMTVFLTPDGRAVLRRHVLPARAAPRPAELPRRCSRRSRARTASGAPTSARSARAARRARSSGSADAARRRASRSTESLLGEAVRGLRASFDPEWGGFGRAPKFPPALGARVPARAEASTELVERRRSTAMAAGGMYDLVGGGFHRYSVDERWLVPHFEKMLYDNALLVPAYLHALARHRRRALPRGRRGDASTTCCASCAARGRRSPPRRTPTPTASRGSRTPGRADEGVPAELLAAVRARALDHPRRARPRAARAAAREPRASGRSRGATTRRSRPGTASRSPRSPRPARRLERDDCVDAARGSAEFLLGPLSDGRSPRPHLPRRAGRRGTGYLDDYADVAHGLYELHVATGELRWLEESRRLALLAVELFADDERGGFFLTPRRRRAARRAQEGPRRQPDAVGQLDARVRAAAARADLRRRRARAARRLASSGSSATSLPRAPSAFGWALCALDLHFSPPREIAIVGPPDDEVARAALARLRPERRRRLRARRGRAAARRARRSWTAGPPSTSASASPAGRRSRIRRR